jgi:T5orf172 domain
MGVAEVRSKKTRASSGSRTRAPKYPLDKAHGSELNWPRTTPIFEVGRRIQDVCFVYVIGEGDDGPVKIGRAQDPIQRLRQMQTGNSRRLRIEAVLLGEETLERLMHEMWEPHGIPSVRNRGKVDAAPGTEWFKADIRPDLFQAVETAADDQLDFLIDGHGEIVPIELARIVLTAHRKHNPSVHQRDEVRLLGAGAGYVRKRASMVQYLDNWLTEKGWRTE